MTTQIKTDLVYKGIEVDVIKRKSKWTIAAYDKDGKQLVTAPSKPKLLAKLSEKTKKVVKRDIHPKAFKRVAKRVTKKDVTKKPKTSIKNVTISLIISSTEDKEIVKQVKEQFPESKFDAAHVSWYRSTLFRDGIIGPEFAPRRSKAYKEWKANNTI